MFLLCKLQRDYNWHAKRGLAMLTGALKIYWDKGIRPTTNREVRMIGLELSIRMRNRYSNSNDNTYG